MERAEILFRENGHANIKDSQKNNAGHIIKDTPGNDYDKGSKTYLHLIEKGLDITAVNTKKQAAFAFFRTKTEPTADVIKTIRKGGVGRMKEWSNHQIATKIEASTYFDAAGASENLDVLRPDPDDLRAAFEARRTIRNGDGQIIGHSDVIPTASHIRHFMKAMARQILLPVLLNRYPDFPYEKTDGLSKSLVETELAADLGKALWGADTQKNIPAVPVLKIMDAATRWTHQNAVIRKQVRDSSLSTDESWHAITQPVQAPNGLWLVPITTPADLEKEGQNLNHCVDDHLPSCLFDNLHVIGVRHDPGKSEFTASIKPNKDKDQYVEDSTPLGYNNCHAPDDVKEAWDWYQTELNKGTWGKPQDTIQYGENRCSIISDTTNEMAIRIGFNPYDHATAHANAQKAWQVWQREMDGMLRFRKDDLDTMLAKTGLNETLHQMAVYYNAVKPAASISQKLAL